MCLGTLRGEALNEILKSSTRRNPIMNCITCKDTSTKITKVLIKGPLVQMRTRNRIKAL